MEEDKNRYAGYRSTIIIIWGKIGLELGAGPLCLGRIDISRAHACRHLAVPDTREEKEGVNWLKPGNGLSYSSQAEERPCVGMDDKPEIQLLS